jgi:hypothetical protein
MRRLVRQRSSPTGIALDFLPPPDSEPEDTSEVVVWTSADIAMWKEIFAEVFAPPPEV